MLNEIVTLTEGVVLVIDDYHVIEEPEGHEIAALLLDRLPPHFHLLIATQADPPFPLGRLRVDGRLTEIRAADLRFTPEETAACLRNAAGVSLSVGDIAALAERTEGWVAVVVGRSRP